MVILSFPRFPCFLYPNTAGYNAEDRANSLICGPIFIRVRHRHITV
jgi:hypothetical protein